MRLKLYLITLFIYTGIGWLWLTLGGQKFSRLQFGNLLPGNLNYVLFGVLYLLAVAGIFYMIVEPSLRRGSVTGAAITGAVVGLVIASADTCANIASGEGSLWLSIAQIIWTPIMIATTTAVTVWVGKKLN